MAKPDQEAHFGISLQSVRKAFAVEHGQSPQTHFAKEVYYPPKLQPIAAQLLPDEKWRQQIRASRQKENNAVAVRATPLLERRPPDVGKVIPIVADRQLQQREDFATRALHVCLERQPHRDEENNLMQQGANALHVARRKPGREVWQPPTALALDRGASAQTKDRRDKKAHAEDRVLKAIRSKADSDGKNARVGYENLAAMTGFSRRHVMRVVKSLIYERAMLRVDKRVMKPGRNAINVYHVVSRDVIATDTGIGGKTGKTGQTETTRVTEPVTPARPRTIPALRHAPLSSALVTEKPASASLTAGRKPRYLAQGVTPSEKAAV